MSRNGPGWCGLVRTCRGSSGVASEPNDRYNSGHGTAARQRQPARRTSHGPLPAGRVRRRQPRCDRRGHRSAEVEPVPPVPGREAADGWRGERRGDRRVRHVRPRADLHGRHARPARRRDRHEPRSVLRRRGTLLPARHAVRRQPRRRRDDEPRYRRVSLDRGVRFARPGGGSRCGNGAGPRQDAVAAIEGALVVARITGDRGPFTRAIGGLPARLLAAATS